jgi:PAS domain S-box-containing protein
VSDNNKNKKQLIEELAALRRRVSELERAQSGAGQIPPLNYIKETYRDFFEITPAGASFLNAIQEPVIIIDYDGIIYYANKTCTQRFNINLHQLLGRCVYDYLPNRNTEKRKRIINESISAGRPAFLRTRLKGSHYDSVIYPIFNDKGKATKALVINQDVTAKVNSVETLKHWERIQAVVSKFSSYEITEKNLDKLVKEALKITTLTININFTEISVLSTDGSKLKTRTAMKLNKNKVTYTDAVIRDLGDDNSISGYIIKTQSPLVIYDSENDNGFKCNLFSKFHIKSALAVPLSLHGRPYGAITISSIRKRKFTRHDIFLCRAMANMLTAAIERSYSENALKMSETNYRAIVENQTDVICRFLPDGTISYANSVFCRYLGKSHEELSGINLRNIYLDSTNNNLLGDLSVFSPTNTTASTERCFILPDGKQVWFNFRTSAIYNKDNRLIEFQAVGRDITEKKQAELLLAESEDHYRRLVEFLPEAIFICFEYKFVFVNNSFLKLFNINSPSEVLGKNMLDFVHPDFKEKAIVRYQKTLKTGLMSPPDEKKMLRPDGSIIDVETMPAPFPYNGKIATLVVVRDMTERNQTKELHHEMEEKSRQLNQAIEFDKIKTEFFSNISHELKTPLSVIFATLQLLNLSLKKSSVCSENTEKYLSIMKQNSYRLLKLVNNIIDITKIDADFYKFNMSNNDIVGVIKEVTLSVEDYVKNKGIELHFTSNVENKIIAFDAEKIERIMLNLLSNSVKFTQPNGSIKVSVWDNGDTVKVCVKDTGIGIPKEKLDVIFERFIQVDKSLTRNHEGSGIGLSIVKSLVEMHNGSIHAVSECGKGSEFTIELPSIKLSDKPGALDKISYIEEHRTEKINIEFSDICIN